MYDKLTANITPESQKLKCFSQDQQQEKDIHSDHFYFTYYWKILNCQRNFEKN